MSRIIARRMSRPCAAVGLGLLVALVLATSTATAAVAVYTNEAAYLAALNAMPHHAVIHEGFEDDAAWGAVRSTIATGFFATPAIVSQGLVWAANSAAGGITTGQGPARSGSWGFYAYPHGSYLAPDPGSDCTVPGDCGDGFRISGSTGGTLYGVGGWVDTNTPFAKIGIFVDSYPDFGDGCADEGVDCDAITVGTAPQFLGLVDAEGFSQVEFRELEGTLEDAKFVFADDFFIALATPVPLPGAALLSVPALLVLHRTRRRSRGFAADRIARSP